MFGMAGAERSFKVGIIMFVCVDHSQFNKAF